MLLFAMLTTSIHAANPEFENAAKLAISEGKHLKGQVSNQVKKFNPSSVFDHYSDHPEEHNYYKEGSLNTSKLDQDAVRQMTNAESGKNILDSMNQRPQYEVKTTDTDIKRSILLQSEADNIVHGMTGRYIDCHAKQQCEMQYIEKMCTASSIHEEMTCKKNLIISAEQPAQAYQTINVHLQIYPAHYMNSIYVKLNIGNGAVINAVGKIGILTVNPSVPVSNCPSLDVKYLGVTNQSGYPLDIKIPTQPSCSNGMTVVIMASSKRSHKQPVDITVSYQIPLKQQPVVEESWSNSCAYLEQLKQQGICQQSKPDICTSTDKTRVINGIEVTRPCWAKTAYYACHAGESDNTCRTTSLDNCEQIGSVCEKTMSGICVSTKHTYRCQQQACINTTDVVCGDGNDYCLDGNCADHSYQSSQDFGKAVASISATNEAVKSYDLNAIFKGKSLECRDDAANFSNCCNESGWGQDVGLAHCSDQEKLLGDSREKELAIKVGRYCSDKVLGICIEHKESFCVFNSKIAKVIQEQGRRGQLHINFGDAKHPDCRGISPNELQRIDFSRISFTQSIFNDITKKMKTVNESEMQKLIEQHVKRFQDTGQSNG